MSRFSYRYSSMRTRARWFSRTAPVLLLGAACAFHSPAYAQVTTADITGTVTDAQGGVLPGATVTLTNAETKETRTAKSDSTGDYVFPLLAPGHYSIRVQDTGFKSFSIADLAVEGGDRARADAQMTVGDTSQTIQVTATTPLLQADNATVSSTVTAAAVTDLPLNGRNFINLVQLVPGANEGPGNGLTSGGRPDDRRSTNGLSVNGQDDVLNNEIIDGLDNNERIIGTIGVKPSVDAIQEITVQTNEYAPEIGRTAGGVINIITKSGSNNFHGSAYEFFRNDVLDARSFFSRVGSTPKPELRQNQYGGSLGGPIVHNKTFFFGDYEGFRQVSGGTTYTSTVPTVQEYDEIHSLNGMTPQDLINSGNVNTGAPVPYAPDPIALNYLKLFPLPNAPGTNGGVSNNYVANPSKTQYSTTVDARVDHSFNANNSLYGRFTYNNVSTDTPAQLPQAVNGVIPGGGRYNFSGLAKDLAYGYQANYTHVFNASWVLELKAGYTRINNLSTPLNYGNNVDTTFGFPGNMNFNQTASGLTPVGISNFEDLGDGAYVPLQDIDNTYEYAGNTSYTVGAHSFKFGASLIRRQARNVQSASALGSYSFGLSTDTAGLPVAQQNTNVLASMLTGAFTGPTRQYDLTPPDYRSWETGVYWQDFWKIRPNITITYGARYDVFTPFTEAHDRISNFDFYQALTDSAATINSALQVAGANGVSDTAGIATDYSNFAPRVGFAATVMPGTVVRGGFGMSYFPGNYTSNADLKNAPFVSVYSPNCESINAYNIQTRLGATGISPACGSPTAPAGTAATATLSQGLPLPVAPDISNLATIPGLSFTAENPHLRQGVVYQYNLLVEKQLGANVATIGYVGEIGSHQPEQINNINLPAPTASATPSYLLAATLPSVTSVGWYDSEGISNYNGLQASLERRLSKGLTVNANYVWSHALDDFTGLSEEGDQGYSNANPHDIRGTEYGNSDNDIRNRFVLQSTYAIPFGSNFTGIEKQVSSGWQFIEIFAVQSGKPFSIINSSAGGCLNPNGTAVTASTGDCAHPFAGVSSGADRPNIIGSTHVSDPNNTEWFNTAAFQGQVIGTVSNQERNQIVGPHFRHLDLSLFKDFPIHEALEMQFRAEFFNITNTPSFYIANNNSANQTLGNGSFGQITQTDANYTPRQIQFALRFAF